MKKKLVFGIDLSDVNNFNEDLVVDLLEKFLGSLKDTCRCQNCLEDMYSLSLKMIEPRYHPNAVTEKVSGTGAYESAQSDFNKKAENEVREAIEIVSNNPHH
ncbi:MAG: late competence development ComFB family protein [Proteobacteria bacterium]|nr:late competence development ComFB family protein [Pseudomonadota bacterium]